MNHLELDGIVTGFVIGSQFIDCIIKDKIVRVDKTSQQVVKSSIVFEKEGFARDMIADETRLFIRDFYTLYILNRNDFSLLAILQLGTDLKSDICGMEIDEDYIYACIRNGQIKKINLNTYNIESTTEYDSGSIWDIRVAGDKLIGSSVDGQILHIDKESMNMESELKLSRQNIGSICLKDNYLYTAGQDKTIHKIALVNGDVIFKKRNAHKRMFDCIDVYKHWFITICYPMSELCFWNKNTFELEHRIEVPLKLSGRNVINDDNLYIASRNIEGLYIINLNELEMRY
ncbi:hypothetical protein [Vallitalea okinawensis]|uniref:hypothetical protein n=1 Tax=Vallitalea okinawensis TaxID=2078660 RepID=UPI000CFDDC49|nr:hypothetical protein [Vallitalea okinawensis]